MKDVEDDKKGMQTDPQHTERYTLWQAKPHRGNRLHQINQKTLSKTEILTVHVEREGRQVSAKWGLNPRLKEELTPEEWKEVTDIMGKVTDIVGKTVFGNVSARADGNRRKRVSMHVVIQPRRLRQDPSLCLQIRIDRKGEGQEAPLIFNQDPFVTRVATASLMEVAGVAAPGSPAEARRICSIVFGASLQYSMTNEKGQSNRSLVG